MREPDPRVYQFLALLIFVAFAGPWLFREFTEAQCQGDLNACKSNQLHIGTAMEMYSTDNDGRYPRNLQMLVPKYLKAIPSCPTGGQSYRAAFGPKAPSNIQGFADYYYLECSGHNHQGVLAPDYPKYNGLEGLIDHWPGARALGEPLP